MTDILIVTPERELTLKISSSTTGQDLLIMTLQQFGLEEVPVFGFEYEDVKGYYTFLKKDKKVLKQGIKHPLKLTLKAQFYPENVLAELHQSTAQRLLTMQVHNAIVSEELYAPAATAVQLAAYVLQVHHGDCDKEMEFNIMDYLPPRVIDQHSFSEDQWRTVLQRYWSELITMTQEQALADYLGVAQHLDMFGTTYFEVENKRGTKMYLGVNNQGMDIFDVRNKLIPKVGFPWREIRNISFDDKKFTIKMVDKNSLDFKFYAPRFKINKRILALCVGNHRLYVARRRGGQTVNPPLMPESAESSLQRIETDLSRVLDKSMMTDLDKITAEHHASGLNRVDIIRNAYASDANNRVIQFNEMDETEA
eukprot:m.86910 g.86910  ORF g.86910 m.86910 type:complete len:366 (-) comp15116_c0_seq2:332-1429(-)